MQSTGQGCFVFSWNQVEVDGLTGSPPDTMVVGAAWRWHGDAMRVDDPRDILVLRRGAEHEAMRARVARKVRRLLAANGMPGRTGEASGEDERPLNSFELTDGLRVFCGTILPPDIAGEAPHVMFEGALPPAGTDLWVLRQEVGCVVPLDPGGLICFLPGTLVETEQGPRPVEDIGPGDRVQTRDNGLRAVVWTGRRRLGAGRLLAAPQLRPIRIRAGALGASRPAPDLLLSPDHRLLLGGAAATELFGEAEVLVSARDLVGLPGVTRRDRPGAVDYVHLALEGHEVITANGLACESFHPATADLPALSPGDAEGLDRLFPALRRDPMSFGPFVRRMLDRAEAALLLHGLSRRPGH